MPLFSEEDSAISITNSMIKLKKVKKDNHGINTFRGEVGRKITWQYSQSAPRKSTRPPITMVDYYKSDRQWFSTFEIFLSEKVLQPLAIQWCPQYSSSTAYLIRQCYDLEMDNLTSTIATRDANLLKELRVNPKLIAKMGETNFYKGRLLVHFDKDPSERPRRRHLWQVHPVKKYPVYQPNKQKLVCH